MLEVTSNRPYTSWESESWCRAAAKRLKPATCREILAQFVEAGKVKFSEEVMTILLMRAAEDAPEEPATAAHGAIHKALQGVVPVAPVKPPPPQVPVAQEEDFF